MEMLCKSPDRYPNALEASPEGLWVGDQVSERINMLDWKTGKVLEDFVGEAHNTSGLAVGGGFIWIGCNGVGHCRALREFKRPYDRNYGEIVKLDMKGKQVKGYRTPWGGVHGTFYHRQTDKLWAVAPVWAFWRRSIRRTICGSSRMRTDTVERPHGLISTTVRSGSSTVRTVSCHESTRRTVECRRIWAFGPNDPDPHGIYIPDDHVYFTNAGSAAGRKPSSGTKPQTISGPADEEVA